MASRTAGPGDLRLLKRNSLPWLVWLTIFQVLRWYTGILGLSQLPTLPETPDKISNHCALLQLYRFSSRQSISPSMSCRIVLAMT